MYSRNYSPDRTLDLSGLSNSTYRNYGIGSSYGGHSGMAANPSLNRVMNMDFGLSDSLSSRSGGLSYESGRLSPLRAHPLPPSLYGDNSRHLQFQTSSPTRLESRLSSTIPSSPSSRRKHVPESRWLSSSRMTNGDYFDFSSQSIMSYTAPKVSSYKRTDYSDYLHPLLGRRPILPNNYTPRSRSEREKLSVPLTRERKLIKFRESSDIVTNVRRRISWILDDDVDSSLTNGLKDGKDEVSKNRSRESSLSRPLSSGGSPRLSRKRFSRDDSLTRTIQASQFKVNDSSQNADINFIQNRSPSPARLPIGSPRRQSRSRSRENSLNEFDILPSPRNLSAALLSREKLRKNSLDGKPPRRKSSCDSLQSSRDILSEIQGNHLKIHDSGYKESTPYNNKPEITTDASKLKFPERLYKTRKSIEEILPEFFEKSNLLDNENKEDSRNGQRKFSGQHLSQPSSESINHNGTSHSRGQKRPSITAATDITSNKIYSHCGKEKNDSIVINTEIKPTVHRKSIKLKSSSDLTQEANIQAPFSGSKTIEKNSKAEMSTVTPEKSARTLLEEIQINSNLKKPIESFSKNKLNSKSSQIDQVLPDQNQVKTKLSHSSFLAKHEVTSFSKQIPEVNSVQKNELESLSQEKTRLSKDAQTTQHNFKTNNVNLEISQNQASANVLSPKSPDKISEKSKYNVPFDSKIKQNSSTLQENNSKFTDSKPGQGTLLQTVEVNHSKESQINHQKTNDLNKPFQKRIQSKEQSSSLTEPLKSLTNLQTDVDKTKSIPKISKVQQYSSKSDDLQSSSTTFPVTKSTEKSVLKDAELTNSKSVVEKTTAKQTVLMDNRAQLSRKLTDSELKTASKTKDSSDKISCNNVSADFKITVDPENIFKRKRSIPVCQIQEKSKPPVSTDTTPTNKVESEEIVVVCKLPQPKWLQQTKNSTFVLPNHIASRGLKAPSVKQVAFQIRKQTGTLIAEEIETTAHASIKVKLQEIDAQMNEVVDKYPDLKKTKQFASLEDHKEQKKVVVPKTTPSSKVNLNLKRGIIIEESKESAIPTTSKETLLSASKKTDIISGNKEDTIQIQENNIKVQTSRVRNQKPESIKTLADKDFQKEQKSSFTSEDVKKSSILKENAAEATNCIEDKSAEKRTSNLKTSSDAPSLKASKQEASDFKTSTNVISFSKTPEIDSKIKHESGAKRVLKTEEKSITTNNKKESISSNITVLNADGKSLDSKSIQQKNPETTIKISDEKPVAPLKKTLAMKQVIPAYAGVIDDTNIKPDRYVEKSDIESAIRNNLQNTETSGPNQAICKTSKIVDLKSHELNVKISKSVIQEKSEIVASEPRVKTNSKIDNIHLAEKNGKFKEQPNLKPKEISDQIDSTKVLKTEKIIEPKKEINFKTGTSGTNKLEITDKQKTIPASEISVGLINRDKEKSNLKPLEKELQNSLNKNEKGDVSKTSKIADLKSQELNVKISRRVIEEKSEIVASEQKLKTEKIDNVHLVEKNGKFKEQPDLKPKKTSDQIDSAKVLKTEKIIEPKKEINFKTGTSGTNKLEITDKQKNTPASEISVGLINRDKEKSNLKPLEKELQNSLNKNEKVDVSKTSKIANLKSQELDVKISKSMIQEKSEIVASVPKVKTNSKIDNVHLVEKNGKFKEQPDLKPKEISDQIDSAKVLKTEKIIEPKKEINFKTGTSGTNKLEITDKQKTIPASEISVGLINRDKEKSNLKPLEKELQNSLNKNEKGDVSKTSKISDLKSQSVEVKISDVPVPGKSKEAIALDSKVKTNNKSENIHFGEKNEREICNQVDNDNNLNKTVKPQDEKYSKPNISISSKLKTIHEKIITPTTEIAEGVGSNDTKNTEKPNFNSITENKVSGSSDVKRNLIACKNAETIDLKSNKSETLASKCKIGYSAPKSIAPDLKDEMDKKDNSRVKETDGQIKNSLQCTTQLNDISISQDTIKYAKASSAADSQKQKVLENSSLIPPKPKIFLNAKDTVSGAVEVSQRNSIENNEKQLENLKISEMIKPDTPNSVFGVNKISNISKGGKEATLVKNVTSALKDSLVSGQKNTANDKTKALTADEKINIKEENKLALGAGSNQPKISSSPVVTEKTSPDEKRHLKIIESSVKTEDASVKDSFGTELVKNKPVPTSNVSKLDDNMKQNAKNSTSIPNKNNSLNNELTPKLILQENVAQNKDSLKNDQSKSDTKSPCINETTVGIKARTVEAKKCDVSVDKSLEKKVETIYAPKSTFNIPEENKHLIADHTVEKSFKTPESENKEKPLSLGQTELKKDGLLKCAKDGYEKPLNKSSQQEGDEESLIKSTQKEAHKFSPKQCSISNKIENEIQEDLSTKNAKLPNRDIYPAEQKSVPTCENKVEDKLLINGCISSPIHKSPKVDEVVPKYPEPKPRKMIGLFTQPKIPAYKTIPESSSSDDSGSDSNEETLPINTTQRKATKCNVTCHQKCEKHMPNLCGVNQKLLSQVLDVVKKGKSSEYDDRGRKRISSADSTVSTATTCSNLSTSSEISNLSDDLRNSSLSPQKRLKFRKYTIDDFQFLKLLGKGSFGKVLLAELKNSSLYFAIKCLKKDVVLEDDDVESTMIERRILALGTQHPYMCKLYCTFQTESHLCFVMEYLNGGDLMFHIQESGRFEQSRAMFYGAEVVSALGFLHKRGIVYRDMKLDNVVLDEEGHVRLVDFGMCQCRIYREECQPFNFCGTPQYIAPEHVCYSTLRTRKRDIKVDNILLDDEGHVHLVDFGMCKVGVIGNEKTATFCGTPDYIPPEIVTGQKYNQSVDWWSFGVLLYEMLTGRSPFNGTDEDELFWSICNEEPHYPRFLTKEALSILQLFLNKNPEKRLGMPSCPEGSIRQHAFFSSIDWNKLEKKQIKPPFKPRVKYASDTSNFDSNFTMDVATLTPVEMDILRSMDQEQFKGFSYTNPHITG